MKIDLLIKNAYVFRTYRQIFEKKDIAILGNQIVRVSDSLAEYEADASEVLDHRGKYIIPGLMDAHMHIESSMTYPAAFSQAALSYGTTTVVSDPHEIANVFGRKGIESFLDQETQIDIFYAIPSSVPSTNETIETSGAILSLEDVKSLLERENVVCLGEVMNFAEVTAQRNTKIKDILSLCKERKRQIKIEGHCPKLNEEELADFILAGVDSDHTQQTKESVLQKIDAGFFIELQEKSLSVEVLQAVAEHNLYESIAFVTDDVMPDELCKGHLNCIVQKAIDLGVPFEKAVYCATYTPARRMQLYDRGSISPGKQADFLVLDEKNLCSKKEVYKSGKRVRCMDYEKLPSKDSFPKDSFPKDSFSKDFIPKDFIPKDLFPEEFFHSVCCKKAKKEDFVIGLNRPKQKKGEKKVSAIMQSDEQSVLVRVIQTSEQGTFTKEKIRQIPVKNHQLCWKEAGITLIAIFERYGKTNQISYGLLEPGLQQVGAIATTWSHDSHNLIVIGTEEEAMVRAQNKIVEMQGGYCVSDEKQITAFAPLKIGGIIATQPIEELGIQIKQVREAIENLGYHNNNVIMSISTLALVVSPELKITDKGLFDVKNYQFKPLILDKGEAIYDSYN